MKYKSKKIVIVISICILLGAMCNITFAHSGRTDSNGGHKDNKNKSGLGSYHYHCGGHPAHLHTNGVCPYSSSSSKTTKKSTKTNSKSSSSSSSSTSSTKSTSSTTYSSGETKKSIPSIIEAGSIEINEVIKEMKVGDSKQLSVSVLPENTTNKEVTWETSDEDVIKVSLTGEITAIGEGKAYITAGTANKKTDSIAILVTEDKKEENNIINNVANQNSINKTSNTNSKSSNPLGAIIALGALGSGGFLGYKKLKK